MSQVAKPRSSRELALERRKALSSVGKAALQGAQQAAEAKSPVSKPISVRSREATASSSIAASSARAASLARRKALSARGKAADTSQDRTRCGDRRNRVEPKSATTTPELQGSEVVANKNGCSCGCKGEERSSVPAGRRPSRAGLRRRPQIVSSTAKTIALARRKALSARGKAALGSGSVSEAQAVRASNPGMSGRDFARVMRDARSRRGNAGKKKSAPSGRQRKVDDNAKRVGAAQDAPWKVGASETTHGQVVTGTMVGRKAGVTGDEPSTCRVITGTEYLGADIFREFCRSDAIPSTARKVEVTTTSHGNPVSGIRLGRSPNVTGNEPGTCKLVTGDEYLSAEQVQDYCGESAPKSPCKISMAETIKGKVVTGDNVGRSEKVTGDEYGMRQSLTGTQYIKPTDVGAAPSKVRVSETLRGSRVTGTLVGRRERMTGDEPGSCRDVAGDDYIGREQYSKFCEAVPQPKDNKVEVDETMAGLTVTGSLAVRSSKVTGDEPGTCKTVTGTPYTSGLQYQQYCSPEVAAEAEARMRPVRKNWGRPITGQQPGVSGLTGAEKGACETVSGTPYMGADHASQVCPATAAEPGSADFPQILGQAPWGDFSVAPPAHAAQLDRAPSQVTGSQYEQGRHITGPFDKAAGKVTGTEEARFDRHAGADVMPKTVEKIAGRPKTRITGEGLDSKNITGDDWNRSEHVTGTEGVSAIRRNPTKRSASRYSVMPAASMNRPEDVPRPVSRVTGSSGNTEKGSLVTYSGGARG